jgi:SAM-dependent methyltransferase
MGQSAVMVEQSTPRDWESLADELAAESLAAGDATGWFDQVYAAGRRGQATLPWDRGSGHPLLRDWLASTAAPGSTGPESTGPGSTGPGGRLAVVVGCGLGEDAELVARHGYTTTAFDVAPTAVELARDRHPGSTVTYAVADLLALPPDWSGGFDLVVDIFTVQALPPALHQQAAAAVADLVAPGGTLLVIAVRRAGSGVLPDAEGPPWPLSRDELQGFAVGDLGLADLEETDAEGFVLWRAVFARPS